MDLVVPKLGESITEAIVSKWLKNVGDAVAIDEPLVELETDKVSVAVPAPAAGVLTAQRAAVGETVNIGAVIGAVDENAKAAAAPKAAEAKPAPQPAAPAPKPAAPVSTTNGSHATSEVPRSKTLPPSVRQAIRDGASQVDAPRAKAPITYGPLDPRDEVVAMTPLRRRIAERLVEAQQSAAILTTFNEVDMTEAMSLRARFQDDFVKKHGLKLGFMSFFVKACVESAKLYPGVNAEVQGTNIIYKKHYDFGIAVGGGKGLVVPVVRNVDQRGFADIEKEIGRLAERAKKNQLTLEEMQGGTFSISNGGIYGSMMSTPLLNMPQTGILGMHNIMKRPIAVGDEIKLRPMMYIALSYDHRVVDGREAVQFLVGVKERIENPERLLLEV
ncbi:MAG: 2-oxoglutarate dehydrogenase complex dihydrolipoyllysine-residue succinyltransferase [Polyangia bacterium]